jgi:hypothetical protein
MTANDRLSHKQVQAILALIGNNTILKVAELVGTTERTIYRWLALPNFKEQLRKERDRIRAEAFDSLKGLLNKAVERLDKLLDADSESIMLKACQTVLDYNINTGEVQPLTTRSEENLYVRVTRELAEATVLGVPKEQIDRVRGLLEELKKEQNRIETKGV